MKSPHTQRPDDEARELTEEFIREHARKAPGEPAREPAAEVQAESDRSPVPIGLARGALLCCGR